MENINKPGVSVIIPTYNREKTIERTVLSIINQNIGIDVEIILVDDCSNDNTVELSKKISEKIVVLKNSINMGAAYSRFFGVSKASYDLVAFLDSDDYVEKNYLRNLLESLTGNKDVVLSFAKVIRGDSNSMQNCPLSSSGFVHDPLEKLYRLGNFACISFMTYKDLILKNYQDRQHMAAANDFDLVCRIATCGDFFYCDQAEYYVDCLDDGISRKNQSSQIAWSIIAGRDSFYYSQRKDLKIKNAYQEFLLNRWPIAFVKLVFDKKFKFAWSIFVVGIRNGPKKIEVVKRLKWAFHHQIKNLRP